MSKSLSESMEDYLEAILVLEERDRVARVKEIAKFLEVKMPSVTVALKYLSEQKLITYEKNSFPFLTDEGRKIAISTRAKHAILTDFFTKVLGIHEKAETIACSFEHIIDLKTAKKFEKLTTYFEQNNIKNIDSIKV